MHNVRAGQIKFKIALSNRLILLSATEVGRLGLQMQWFCDAFKIYTTLNNISDISIAAGVSSRK